MQTPLSTQQVEDIFCVPDCPNKDDCYNCVEGETCSVNCKQCGTRLWFVGTWTTEDVPKTFKCFNCGTERTMVWL